MCAQGTSTALCAGITYYTKSKSQKQTTEVGVFEFFFIFEVVLIFVADSILRSSSFLWLSSFFRLYT